MKSPEYLSKDILDEDFVRVFSFPFLVQMALGSCRVHLKARFITVPTLGQKLYTVMCIIICSLMYFNMTKLYLPLYYEHSIVYYIFVTVTGLDQLSFFANLIHLRFLNGETNTAFYIMMQRIDRNMKIDHNNIFNKTVTLANILTITLIILHYVGLVISTIILKEYSLLSLFGLLYGQLMLMVEMALCSNLIIFFFMRVRFVNAIIKNHVHPENQNQPPKLVRYFITNRITRYLAAQTHDFIVNDTDVYLKQIFEGFSMFIDIYRFQVCPLCIKLVVLTLLNFEFCLVAIQRNVLGPNHIGNYYIIVNSVMGFFTALYVSGRCELFFREIRETKRLSVAVLLQYQEGPLREKATRMLKIIEESTPQFSIYDMWQMDGYTFVKICSLVTNLIVTLLQFAYL
ncbi:gustatory receptor 45 [Bombyx mori]|uniref:Gustatory receptor 45 n=1 Tax=Bombyx mori TaxID=7091 RepID=B3GTD8_BOMMO|nr:gustatory receptor 45 [Bombyx mori]ACD85124.1 gustatory receptor 45 [Bombyx mori]